MGPRWAQRWRRKRRRSDGIVWHLRMQPRPSAFAVGILRSVREKKQARANAAAELRRCAGPTFTAYRTAEAMAASCRRDPRGPGEPSAALSGCTRVGTTDDHPAVPFGVGGRTAVLRSLFASCMLSIGGSSGRVGWGFKGERPFLSVVFLAAKNNRRSHSHARTRAHAHTRRLACTRGTQAHLLACTNKGANTRIRLCMHAHMHVSTCGPLLEAPHEQQEWIVLCISKLSSHV